MLTAKQIDSLPKGVYHNSTLRKIFGPKHGRPVQFQDKDGHVHTFVSNRWWHRYRKRNPLRKHRAKVENIETEFGVTTKTNKNWFGKFLSGTKDWFKGIFG